jgi:rubredoxin-NAD+ reductase
MPVVIKTPALAVVVCPPPPGATGHWRTSGDERNVRAIFQADDDSALGFALTGEATAEKQALTKMISASR